MIVDATKGARGLLIDLDRNEPIRFARWADTDTGEYVAFRVGPDGRIARGPQGQILRYRGRTRLKWVPTVIMTRPAAPAVPPPPAPGVLLSPFDLHRCDRPDCLRWAEWKVAEEEELEPLAGPDGRPCERARLVGVRYWCSWHYRYPTLRRRDGEVVETEVTARPD